ncbi:MAG: phosphomannomutase/phosphoglucomutase [Nitrospirae bacterium]|nr:phosphomannomutase/phosphoglucomutase [Nitrospirota bacterium]
MSIFKAYDIRGIVPAELNEGVAEKVGRSVVKLLNARTLVVGRDMRASAEVLFDALTKGITSMGAEVIDIGLCSTPMSYFADARFGADGSVMITASHNPSQYNGFKICREDAIPLSYETGIGEIERLSAGEGPKPAGGAGRVSRRDAMGEYLEHVLRFAGEVRPMTVAVDAGNAIAGYVIPKLLAALPQVKVVPLYFELDGSFPNHEPNPLKEENMRDLRKKVKETGADFGVAFDGDADRAAFVDDRGELIAADLLTALLAPVFLKREKGGTVIYDVRSSRVVREEVERAGGRAIMSRVGHSYMKTLLRREKGVFGGELAGHFYFRDNAYADSGDITLMLVMKVLSESSKPLSALVAPLRRFHASGEINFHVDDKDGKIEELARLHADGEINRIDGIRVDYPDWWFNVRKSNTEPLLRLVLEADSREKMERMRDKLAGEIGGRPEERGH